ncbi:MAG: hypothetical protein SYR96_17815 [Actinomycetota bacterium]|nr:hypothetical protein [Actinomycetota bacterium]
MLLGLSMVVAGRPVAGALAGGASIALVGVAFTGVAVWPEHRGAVHASPSLLSPAGLIWRQQRPALVGWAAGLAWTLVVFAVFAGPMFGPSLNLHAWLLDLSPFTHVPNVPAEGASAVPLVGRRLGFVLLALAGAGLLRRRDLALPT